MKDVPIYFISGWYDYFVEGVIENFAGLSRIQKTPKKLQLGPWPHGIGRSECGDCSFGEAAQVDHRELALDWFDHWMKDDPLDKIGPEPVRIFRMGGGAGSRTASGKLDHGGAWQTAAKWPVTASGTRYYLGDNGSLSATKPRPATASFVFDPDNPVPTIGGRPFGGVPPCAQDQSPLDSRTDILRFVTDPLADAVEVTGTIRARLSVSSDAPDTDFTVKLIDVYSDGYALILADGIIRTRYRNGQQKAELMKPGKVYEVPIDLGTTSNLFAKGHRIRVDISSSNFPHREPNPNTGEPVDRWTRKVKARNTVHLGASFVELPVRKP
jgi:putative CocE/NonD family hydrolase